MIFRIRSQNISGNDRGDIDMQRKFPNLTPVKHKKDGYQGWIDGVTKIESLFTGDSDLPWQYRVYLPEGGRKVAPEEDLEHNLDLKGLPPQELRGRYAESFEGESDLHAIGYNLTEHNPLERRELLIFCALPMFGPDRVLRNLCDILWRKVRRNKEEKIEKYHNAIEQWSHDLDFVLQHESVDLETLDQETLNYVVAVKEHIAQYTDIQSHVPVDKIFSMKINKGDKARKTKKS